MRKGLFGVFFSFIVIASALNAGAQIKCPMGAGSGMMMDGMGPAGMDGGMMMREGGTRLWEKLMALGLDARQVDELKAIRTRMMKSMVRKRADRQLQEIEIHDLLDKDSVDMKAVEAAVKKSASLRADMFLAHVKAREEMKAVLTPAQRKQLREMSGMRPGENCGMMRR
jgi:Spy/CpxP family protein refolding chaperone